MKDFIKKYEIWIFLVLAPITNAIFVYGISIHIIPGRLYLHGRFFTLLFLLIAIIWYTHGKESLRDIFKPMLNWKVSLNWLLLALFFAPTMACITLILKALYLDNDFSVFKLNTVSVTEPMFMFNLILFAFVGEVVWVSYVVRKLSENLNLFFSSQITGFVWGLWWFPIVLLNVGVIPDLPLLPLIINMMGAAGMCAFIYVKTKSGICVWVLQIMLNTSGILFPISPVSGGIPTYITFCIVYFIMMLVCMCFLYSKKNKISITLIP